jgi:lysophospholipase L1-like esterase
LIEATIEHLVARVAALQRAHGFRLLLVMDGARQAIYDGRDSRALALNRMVGAAASRHGVAYIDLHPLFAEAWRRDKQRFEFAHDGHWNARGHELAARAIRDWIDR